MKRDYRDDRLNRSNYSFFRWFGFDLFEPERAVTSYWIPSKVFLIIRLIICVYSTIIIWGNLANSAISYKKENTPFIFFGYFTNLTFIGLHAYYVTVCYHHVRYILSKGQLNSFFNQPTTLNYLFIYLYHTIITFNIVTPVVYWSFLNGTEVLSPLQTFFNVSVHGVSFFMMLIDVILNRIQIYTNMVLLLIINVAIYMCLSFVVYSVDDIWVYPFLDWSGGLKAALMYIVVGTIFIIAFFIILAIHDLRDWIAKATGCAPNTINPRSMEYYALPIYSEGTEHRSSPSTQVDQPEMSSRSQY
ncbi:hypothetical protein BJ944DRAFT_264360 [Cunninghamella echinulata]|nr:hypothetical protein BJ944DRAFT_264360 [Cunninghamella echinulata]